MDAVEEVFTENALAHEFAQVLVRRRDDPHVGLDRLDRPERFINPLLQHPQQSDLHGRRDVADLVQKQRTAVGQSKAAEFILPGISKCPRLVTEQFRFQEGIGQRPAIQCDESFLAPPRKIVDGSGE